MSQAESKFMIIELIAIVSIVIALVAGYLLRKRLMLAIVAMNKGIYSYEYISLFKRLYLRNPYKGCIREDLITRIQPVFEAGTAVERVSTHKSILFEDEPFGQSLKELIGKYGKPLCYTVQRVGDQRFTIAVAGFRSKGYRKELTPLYYFLDDQFFMGEYLINRPWDFAKIRDGLIEQFQLPIDNEVDNFIIENTKERTVHYKSTGFAIEVKYLSSEATEILEKINEYKVEVMAKQNAFAMNLKPLLSRH
jgi:hypothetical protein